MVMGYGDLATTYRLTPNKTHWEPPRAMFITSIPRPVSPLQNLGVILYQMTFFNYGKALKSMILKSIAQQRSITKLGALALG